MPKARAGDGARSESAAVELVVGYVGPDGAEHQVILNDAVSVPLEHGLPVSTFPSYRRQCYFPGRWWAATTGSHVGYESWLERDHLIALDHDPRSGQAAWSARSSRSAGS